MSDFESGRTNGASVSETNHFITLGLQTHSIHPYDLETPGHLLQARGLYTLEDWHLLDEEERPGGKELYQETMWRVPRGLLQETFS